VRLSSFFGHDTNEGAFVRSLLFVDPHGLHWNASTPGKHATAFQVTLLAVGDNGDVLAEWRRLVPVSLDDEQFRLSQERGILYSAQMRIREPGAYQVRAAVLDVHTEAVGSASQYVEVPPVGAGRLALSSLVLQGVSDVDAVLPTESAEAPGGLADAVLSERTSACSRPAARPSTRTRSTTA
jgi:hypothetical protein